MKKIILYFLLIVSSVSLAQTEEELKSYGAFKLKRLGKQSLKINDYGTASRAYERYLELKPNKTKMAYKLGLMYESIRDYEKALKWFTVAYERSNNIDMMALYKMAIMQKQTGDCANAAKNLKKFRWTSGDDPAIAKLKKQMKNETIGCDSLFKSYNPNAPTAIITRLDNEINKVNVEARPIQLSDKELIYSSLRVDGYVYKYLHEDSINNNVTKFYKAKKVNGKWQYDGEYEAANLYSPGVNNTNGTISQDGNKMYLTRVEEDTKGNVFTSIFVSDKRGDEWSEAVKLPDGINILGFSSTQPFVVYDKASGYDIVYYSSNKPVEGRDGFDLYYFTYSPQKRKYTSGKPLGPKINTFKDEITPFYDVENNTLYFSSNGMIGVGGFDIYRSRGELKKWSTPENLGLPINSGADDVYYSSALKLEDGGFFVSNRPGGNSITGNSTCCDDIYSYKKSEYLKVDLKGIAYERQDDETDADKILAQNARVGLYIVDPRETTPILVKQLPIDSLSAFASKLELGYNYKILAEKPGYKSNPVFFTTIGIRESVTITKDVLLIDVPPKESFILKNVYYELDKFDLTEASKVVIDTTLLRFLQKYPDVIIEVSSHTDSIASDKYNQNLSKNRAAGVVKYLISKNVLADRLQSAGYGESRPIALNTNPDGTDNYDGRAKNRRTEIRVLGKLKKGDSIRNLDLDE